MSLKVEKKFFGLIRKKIIPREDGKDYLIRYSFPTFSWLPFAIKIHKIILSDDECLHDHPWLFYSFILKGGYWEYTPPVNQHILDVTDTYQGVRTKKEWFGIGSFLKRPAHWIHRLEIPEGKPCWTLVFTFKKKREWGFFTKNFGFIHYSKYNSKEHCE